MADRTYTQIRTQNPATVPLVGTEIMVVTQGGITRGILVSDITNLILTNASFLRQRKYFEAAHTGLDQLIEGSPRPFPAVNAYSVTIPTWATTAIVLACISNAYNAGSDPIGCNNYLQIALGNVSGSNKKIGWTSLGAVFGTSPNQTSGGGVASNSSSDIFLGASLNCVAQRGQTVQLRTQGYRVAGTDALSVSNTPGGAGASNVFSFIDIEFIG